MDANFKKLFVEKLRSGEYRQTMGGLRTTSGYCCLGVLCDISGLGRWVEIPGEASFMYYNATFDNEFSGSILPDSIRSAVGLTDDEQDHLWRLNDEEVLSFDQIADYVEVNIPGVKSVTNAKP